MVDTKRYTQFYCFLIFLNYYQELADGFSLREATRNYGVTSSLHLSSSPSSCLFSTNGDDSEGSGSTSDNSRDDKYSDIDVDDVFNQASKISQPTKSGLYGDDELAGLLNMHQQLQSAMTPPPPEAPIEPTEPEAIEDPSNPFAGGLHDLILQTVENIDDDEKEVESPTTDGLHDLILETVEKIEEEENKPPPPQWISESVRENISKLNIIAVASDVDGTIIGSDQKIHPRTVLSINAALNSSKLDWIFPATGKTRWGATNSLGPELSSFTQGPGVYNQGLYCLGNNGEVIFEKKLTASAVQAAEQLVADSGISVVAYDGDDLYTTDLTKSEVIDLHEKWGEPSSKEISSLLDHAPGIHKILLMDNGVEKLTKEVRPKLEKLAKETGSVVTQAVPTMLELLPSGCSKAVGVQKVCEHLGIDPGTQLLTLGDAENDVGMLEISAIGVAVGNAGIDAKDAADIILPITSDDGGVGLALNDILGV
mmetsp:Transcript_9236/g.20033  ORF Transcript_9236/g.20033 Transcript_9236/m.20033 type:complete len:482 (+) Transcript_9236:142-1587(+)